MSNEYQQVGNHITNGRTMLSVIHPDGDLAAVKYAHEITHLLNTQPSLRRNLAYYVDKCSDLERLRTQDVATLTQQHKLQRIQCAGLAGFVGLTAGMLITALMVMGAA